MACPSEISGKTRGPFVFAVLLIMLKLICFNLIAIRTRLSPSLSIGNRQQVTLFVTFPSPIVLTSFYPVCVAFDSLFSTSLFRLFYFLILCLSSVRDNPLLRIMIIHLKRGLKQPPDTGHVLKKDNELSKYDILLILDLTALGKIETKSMMNSYDFKIFRATTICHLGLFEF